MKTNVALPSAVTHEGGHAMRQTPLRELERAVSTCLLWENTFYEQGSAIGQRIADLCAHVTVEQLAALSVRARTDLKLRHVPLWLVRHMARHHKGQLVGDTLAAVIRRPDEITEFLALYWRDKREPLSAQVKRGLRLAFAKFDAQALAKWDRAGKVRLRDALFLCHAKPKDAEQDAMWKHLIAGTLPPADTWEVALSGGADKREAFERLLRERRLGYMALLMNLRNMAEAGVDRSLVETALRDGAPRSMALPFRFIAAMKAAPSFAQALSDAMVLALGDTKISGDTVLLIDVSGSMNDVLSSKGTLSRWEAAAALAVLFREAAPTCRVFTFSHDLVEVANLRGLALVHAVGESQNHGGTYLAGALEGLKNICQPHRLIVVTDEQAHDGITPAWAAHSYLVNVAPYKPSLDTTQGWMRISGWSERLVDWIKAEESESLGRGDDDAA